ncbi:MAG: hypothetical protein V9F03_07455 [Microthrixaceae bacterium]
MAIERTNPTATAPLSEGPRTHVINVAPPNPKSGVRQGRLAVARDQLSDPPGELPYVRGEPFRADHHEVSDDRRDDHRGNEPERCAPNEVSLATRNPAGRNLVAVLSIRHHIDVGEVSDTRSDRSGEEHLGEIRGHVLEERAHPSAQELFVAPETDRWRILWNHQWLGCTQWG